jgi:hypothetical protein
MKDKIFIVPKNDLESVEIAKILRECGWKDGVDLFITNQSWGASWKGLEPEIIDMIRQQSERIKTVVNTRADGYGAAKRIISRREYDAMPHLDYVGQKDVYGQHTIGEPILMEPDFSHIYGVELKGQSPCHDIDHHSYCDKDWSTGKIIYQEDRTRDNDGKPRQSSIAQVAELIGVELTLDQKFIGANDRGFVEGMMKYGKHIFMTDQEISEKISDIRMREHKILAEIQGITPEMEHQAEIAIQNAVMMDNGTMIVVLPHSKCATVTDRIPEQEYNGGLLIICADGELDYYGPSEVVKDLHQEFGGWSGDVSESFTFWGLPITSINNRQLLQLKITNWKLPNKILHLICVINDNNVHWPRGI